MDAATLYILSSTSLALIGVIALIVKKFRKSDCVSGCCKMGVETDKLEHE